MAQIQQPYQPLGTRKHAGLLKRCPDIQTSDAELKNLIEQIEGVNGHKLLTEDPTLANLKPSQHIRLARIFLRFIRIILIEAELKGKLWLPLLKILSYLIIVLIGIFELFLTALMKVFQFLGF